MQQRYAANRSESLWIAWHLREIALILIAVIWGATFSPIQLGLKDSGPPFLVGLRFLFASLMFGLPSLTALRGLERVDLHADVKIGAVYALICVLQAYACLRWHPTRC